MSNDVPLLTAEMAVLLQTYDPSVARPQLLAIADGRAVVVPADELAALQARVLELECGRERARALREAGFVPRPPIPSDADEDERMNAIAQNGNDGLHYVDAGPTPLRGRVTRRDE